MCFTGGSFLMYAATAWRSLSSSWLHVPCMNIIGPRIGLPSGFTIVLMVVKICSSVYLPIPVSGSDEMFAV